MKLVNNWRDAWRWYSMWAFAAINVISGAGGITAYLTPQMLAAKVLFFPAWTWAEVVFAIIAFLAVTGGIGRMLSQERTTVVDIEVAA